MAVKTTSLFKINNQEMIVPDAGVAFEYNDLDGEETGRDESGYMHRVPLRYKVGSWDFNFSEISDAEKEYMESLFPAAPDFNFTHPSRGDASVQETTRCYCSQYGISWHDATRGIWKNFKFKIIEV